VPAIAHIAKGMPQETKPRAAKPVPGCRKGYFGAAVLWLLAGRPVSE